MSGSRRSSRLRTSPRKPVDPSSGSRNELIKCLCGFDYDDGFIIMCDKCSVWQHCACLGIVDRNDIPKYFTCDSCSMKLRAERAQQIQLQLRNSPVRGKGAARGILNMGGVPPPVTLNQIELDVGHWTKREGEKSVVYRRLIGAGGYGEVHELFDKKNSQAFARKLIRPFAGKVDENDIANEVKAINALCGGSHKNIVRVFRHGRLRADSAFYFIDMELCRANLEDYILGRQLGGLPLWQAAVEQPTVPVLRQIMIQICDGLEYIHSQNQVHRDLNPQNGIPQEDRVLYTRRLWKIADFGLTSEAMTSEIRTTQFSRGKAGYRAPELLRDPRATYNKKVDIWSLGCVLYELLTRQKLFSGDTAIHEFAVLKSKKEFDLSRIDESSRLVFSGLLNDMLEVDFRIRPSAEDVRTRLNEFTSTNSKSVEPRKRTAPDDIQPPRKITRSSSSKQIPMDDTKKPLSGNYSLQKATDMSSSKSANVIESTFVR